MASTFKQKVTEFFKERQTRGFLISVVVMAAISFLFFVPDNIEGNDLQQHDMVQGMANGHEIMEYQQATGVKSWWTNSLFSGMPTFQISPSYSSNSLFSWITTVYGLGLPAPSNLLFMMMLGFMILMLALRVRWEYGLLGAIAWGLSSYFVIIIGAGHIWKFVTLAYIPPTIAGILLCYRGRLMAGGALASFFAMMQISSNHIQMTYYFGFVIAAVVVAYFVSAIRSHEVGKWCKATGILAAAALLAVAANLPNLYHTSKYAKETQRAASELSTGGDDAVRAKKDWITEYSYGRAETFSLFIPNVKGGASIKMSRDKQLRGQSPILSLAELPAADKITDAASRQILPQVPQYFGEPQMTNGPVYVGVIIFALFLIGCVVVKGALKWALVAATVLSILLAWGRNFMGLTDLFIDFVPMYNQFRTPESILVIAQFTMPLLAVLALVQLFGNNDSQLTDAKAATRRSKKLPSWQLMSGNMKATLICFGVVALFCIIGCLFPGFYGSEDDLSRQVHEMSYSEPAYRGVYDSIIDLRHSMVSNDSARSLMYLLIAAAAVIGWQLRWFKSRTVAVGVLTAAVLIDLYTVDKRYVDHDSFIGIAKVEKYKSADTKGVKPTQADLEIMKDDDPHYRVLDLDRFSSAEPSFYHKTLGGYHAAKLGRYQDLIERHIMRLADKSDYGVVDMLNAKYFIYQGQVMENPEALGNAWWIDAVEYVDGANAEMDALDRIDVHSAAVADRSFEPTLGKVKPHAQGDTIYLTSYAPNRLAYKANTLNGATAAFSEVYFPWGWKATIDGKPADIARVNYILRAINIPAGEHEIVMTFDPESVKTTESVATISVIAIYLWVIAACAATFGLSLKLKNRKKKA